MTSQESSAASNSKYLFLSCSGGKACVGLFSASAVISELTNLIPKQHSEWLFPALQDLLSHCSVKIEDLSGLVFDKGPGSFTGVRLAVSIAKTLSYATGLSLLGLTSLELLLEDSKLNTFAAINAFGNKFYVQSRGFDFDLGPAVITKEDLIKVLPKAAKGQVKLVGDGFASLTGINFDLHSDSHFVNTESARKLAIQFSKKADWTNDWKSVQPLYLRRSEAEERLNGKSNSLGSRIR